MTTEIKKIKRWLDANVEQCVRKTELETLYIKDKVYMDSCNNSPKSVQLYLGGNKYLSNFYEMATIFADDHIIRFIPFNEDSVEVRFNYNGVVFYALANRTKEEMK